MGSHCCKQVSIAPSSPPAGSRNVTAKVKPGKQKGKVPKGKPTLSSFRYRCRHLSTRGKVISLQWRGQRRCWESGSSRATWLHEETSPCRQSRSKTLATGQRLRVIRRSKDSSARGPLFNHPSSQGWGCYRWIRVPQTNSSKLTTSWRQASQSEIQVSRWYSHQDCWSEAVRATIRESSVEAAGPWGREGNEP